MKWAWLPMMTGFLILWEGWKFGFQWDAIALFLIGVIGWFLYVNWVTDFSGRDKETLSVGKPFPDIQFQNLEGNTIPTRSFVGAPAIFLFYRGNWCPFCVAQIKELAKEYRQIKAKGAELVFISPQSPKHTASLAKKFDIPARFLLDEDLKGARQLGLFDKGGTPAGFQALGYTTDNVLPTVIVTDKDGIIRYADLTDSYRLRPEPKSYLKILDGFSR